MDVIVVANQKGGSGKTTLVRNLAVAADNAVMIDRDPQGSLTAWWNRRAADAPPLVQIRGTLAETLDALRDTSSVETVFVDTPPSVSPALAETIEQADLVLVPIRPTPDDLDAVGPILDMVEGAGRPFLLVLSQVKPRTRLAADALAALAQHGPVAPVLVHDRVDFPTAAISGQAVTELPTAAAAAREVRALLDYVRTQLRKSARR